VLVCVNKHGLLHGSSDEVLYLSVSLKELSLFLINKYVGFNVIDKYHLLIYKRDIPVDLEKVRLLH